MKISRTIAYAIDAAVQLAHGSPGVPVPCSELARVGAIPKRFLLQVLRRLVRHDVLRSTRGADGGYCLSRPPEQITLRDIVEAFDMPADAEMPALPGMPPAVRLRVLQTLGRMPQAARAELATLSLADLNRLGAGHSSTDGVPDWASR